MNEVVQNILLLSAVGSVLALVLLCIKPLTKRLFSPKWQYYVWLTVLIVMVLPVKLSLPAEPVHITPIENTSAQTQQITPEAQQEPAQPAALEKIAQRPALRIPDIPNAIVQISGFLWLAATALLLGYRMTKYIMFLRTIKKYSVPECSLQNIPKRLTVRKTKLLDAPLIVGLIKPVLYLPQTEIKEDELDYILLHELTHYRRHDLLYKWFAMLVSSIHWFNPFVYIVSRQIDEECEVSCDYAVCKTLTEPQKKDYMAMILDFVQTSIQKNRPLTTQMASSKKILKRRFLMMKTKKTTGKFVSVLSVVLALAMLSTTVFASGVLSGLTEDNYTVEISNNGEVIELVNKPFIENGEVYVPLREMLEKVGFDKNNSNIVWKDGKVGLSLVQTNGHAGAYCIKIGFDGIWCSLESTVLDDTALNYIIDNSRGYVGLNNNTPPVLKNSVTYMSVKDFNYIIYSFLDVRDENNELYEITYKVYDKNRNIIDSSSGTTVIISQYENTTPEYTVDQFFQHLEQGQVEQANMYCVSDSRIDRSFGTQKRVSDITVDYTIDSFGQISAECYAEFIDEEHLADDYQPVHWKIYLVQQPDNTYLINGWESLDV